jgi:hypothetical protein
VTEEQWMARWTQMDNTEKYDGKICPVGAEHKKYSTY